MKHVFKAILVYMTFAVVAVAPNVKAESTTYEKTLATKKSQALLDELDKVGEKFKPKIQEVMRISNTDKRIFKYGTILREFADEMYKIISKSEAPEELKLAALECAQAYENAAVICHTAPHIPSSNSEAFWDGVVDGLSLDINASAKYKARQTDFLKRYNDAFAEASRKFTRLKIVAIKYGVKFE